MGYIIINGKKSTTVRGLLIQTQPHISLPPKRVLIEEVDGRDGDITEVLGYSAYDKSFDIGLYGDYMVDEVINYFDTSGQIVFSSEPDKYYNFEMIEQIDLERLLRYKTATVTLHVQPFKYDADETEVVWTDDTEYCRLELLNKGNYIARPELVIVGDGPCNIEINGVQVLTCEYILDTLTLRDGNAFDYLGRYYNRRMRGDYEDLCLQPGPNVLVVDGEISRVKVNKISRWR